MSDQRIDTGAGAATGTDADPGEGLGTADPGAHADPLDPRGHRTSGGDAEMPQPTADGPGAAPGGGGDADTEGASALQDAQQAVAEQQRGEPDLSGREPAGDEAPRAGAAGSAGGPAGGAGSDSGVGERPVRAQTGEVSAAPSPQRRAEDPGSVATEFGDRADSAPEDDVARPTT
jgi:hypothetical protein